MATQKEVDAGLTVLNDMLDRTVSAFYRSAVDAILTEDVKFNLILDIVDAAKKASK